MYIYDRTEQKLINLKHVRRIELVTVDGDNRGYLEFEYQDGGNEDIIFANKMYASSCLEDIINELSCEALILNIFDSLPADTDDDLPFK